MNLTISQIATLIAVLILIGLLIFMVFARRVFLAGLRADSEEQRLQKRREQAIAALVTRAHAYADLGDREAARKELETALSYLHEDDPEAAAIQAELDRLSTR